MGGVRLGRVSGGMFCWSSQDRTGYGSSATMFLATKRRNASLMSLIMHLRYGSVTLLDRVVCTRLLRTPPLVFRHIRYSLAVIMEASVNCHSLKHVTGLNTPVFIFPERLAHVLAEGAYLYRRSNRWMFSCIRAAHSPAVPIGPAGILAKPGHLRPALRVPYRKNKSRVSEGWKEK